MTDTNFVSWDKSRAVLVGTERQDNRQNTYWSSKTFFLSYSIRILRTEGEKCSSLTNIMIFYASYTYAFYDPSSLETEAGGLPQCSLSERPYLFSRL